MKAQAKRIANAVAAVAVALPVLLYFAVGWILGPHRVFYGWSQALSLIPGATGVLLRRGFYRMILATCGSDASISFGALFSHPTVSLGRGAYIGVGCMLGDVAIGDDVLVGSHASIINGNRQHGIERLDIPVRDQSGQYPRITIGDDTWIGDRAVVMANVGKHCVVGAGAVVTKSVPDYAIVVGNPARVAGDRRELCPTPLTSVRAESCETLPAS